MKRDIKQNLFLMPAVLLAGALLFTILFSWDNKYAAALPGGPGYNVLQGNPERAAFLVGGWEYYPGELLTPADLAGREAEAHTYAGEHPNFSKQLGSPYGAATYRLYLKNTGNTRELALYLPELLCAGRVYINGVLAGTQGSVQPYRPYVMDGIYAFSAGADTEIVIQRANYTHYYSGMYYLPAIGTPQADT
ncbi:MAG: hypothetical protein HFG45_06750 [Oscillospiraceae bacterium]|jgi:hypothetical protein|nr:hypothetical protein [Oscillospiraceae bacterium]